MYFIGNLINFDGNLFVNGRLIDFGRKALLIRVSHKHDLAIKIVSKGPIFEHFLCLLQNALLFINFCLPFPAFFFFLDSLLKLQFPFKPPLILALFDHLHPPEHILRNYLNLQLLDPVAAFLLLLFLNQLALIIILIP